MVMRVTLRFSVCCLAVLAVLTFTAKSLKAAEPLAFRHAIDLALHHSTTMAIASADQARAHAAVQAGHGGAVVQRSEEHTSELQSHLNLVCRLLLEKKKTLQQLQCLA